MRDGPGPGSEPGWCPAIERREERERRRAEEARRVTLGDYITQSYTKWRATNRAISGWKTDRGRLKVLVERLGDQYLDAITPQAVESFRDALIDKGRARATANRYRDHCPPCTRWPSATSWRPPTPSGPW